MILQCLLDWKVSIRVSSLKFLNSQEGAGGSPASARLREPVRER